MGGGQRATSPPSAPAGGVRRWPRGQGGVSEVVLCGHPTSQDQTWGEKVVFPMLSPYFKPTFLPSYAFSAPDDPPGSPPGAQRWASGCRGTVCPWSRETPPSFRGIEWIEWEKYSWSRKFPRSCELLPPQSDFWGAGECPVLSGDGFRSWRHFGTPPPPPRPLPPPPWPAQRVGEGRRTLIFRTGSKLSPPEGSDNRGVPTAGRGYRMS